MVQKLIIFKYSFCQKWPKTDASIILVFFKKVSTFFCLRFSMRSTQKNMNYVIKRILSVIYTVWPNNNDRQPYHRNESSEAFGEKLWEVKWPRKIAGKYFRASRVVARGRNSNGQTDSEFCPIKAYRK